MRKLTDKQLKFAHAKAEGLGHTQAALVAGFAPTSAAVTASQLMKRPDIKAAIKAAKKSAGKPADDGEPVQARLKDHYETPLDLMMDVVNMPAASFAIRFEAAKQALPYKNARVGETGKKETQKERAQKISKGRFGTKAPPSASRATH